MKIKKSRLRQIIREEISAYRGRSQRHMAQKPKHHSVVMRGTRTTLPSMSQRVYGISDDDLDPLLGGMTDPEAEMSIDPSESYDLEEEVRAAAPDPVMGRRRPKNARDLAKMIAGPAKTFGAYERPDELQEYPLSVYADLMGTVISAWGKLANNVHGCKMNSETKECQIISSVIRDFHNKIGPLVDAAANLEGKAAARFIIKNSRMLAASMDWVPASKKPSDFPNTKVWQQADKSGAYVDPDDDL
jgi:hypothetical protein